jgi:hypothetical protein
MNGIKIENAPNCRCWQVWWWGFILASIATVWEAAVPIFMRTEINFLACEFFHAVWVKQLEWRIVRICVSHHAQPELPHTIKITETFRDMLKYTTYLPQTEDLVDIRLNRVHEAAKAHASDTVSTCKSITANISSGSILRSRHGLTFCGFSLLAARCSATFSRRANAARLFAVGA